MKKKENKDFIVKDKLYPLRKLLIAPNILNKSEQGKTTTQNGT